MEQLLPHEQIAALRAERKETLATFASAIGCSSKGRISEMENGKARPTVAQAIQIEALSGGRIDAGALCEDVRLSRQDSVARHNQTVTPALPAASPGKRGDISPAVQTGEAA